MVKRAAKLAILLAIGCGGAARSEPSVAQPARPVRAMVYSAAFAKRFELPKGGIEPLDPGVEAIVLRVVQRTALDAPACSLDFYLDDTLDIAYPSGSEGIMLHEDADNPLFFSSEEHHRWDAMLGNYHSVACVKTLKKDCMNDGGGPSAFARHLLPGIALVTYRLVCDALEPDNGPTEMWLLREGRDTKDVQDLLRGDPTATIRFKVPFSLIQHAAPRVREAMKFFDQAPTMPEPPRNQFTVPR